MIDRLKLLGFSDNESKVYLELLRGFPETAYQIAKRTGLAGANVYQVLATMVKKGFVIETEGEKKLYKPIDPSNWIYDKKSEFEENIAFVEEELNNMFESPEEDYFIYRIKNKAAVTRKINELIQSAELDIYFDLFPSNFKLWRNLLIKASQRGVIVKGIIYEDFSHTEENMFISKHPAASFVLNEHSGNLFSILIDAKEAIFGLYAKDGSLRSCFWSKNAQLCFMLESGMRSEMMHWFLLQNIDINNLLDKDKLAFYNNLRTAHSLKKRIKNHGHAID